MDLVGAELHGLDFRGEDLRGFNFSRADLTGSDFRKANVEGVSFADADLTGVIGLSERRELSRWPARTVARAGALRNANTLIARVSDLPPRYPNLRRTRIDVYQ